MLLTDAFTISVELSIFVDEVTRFCRSSSGKQSVLMNKPTNIKQELLEKFGKFDTWMDKYNFIIELGKSLPELSDEHKREEKLIKGCQSRVWLHAELLDGKVIYFADSDSMIEYSGESVHLIPE